MTTLKLIDGDGTQPPRKQGDDADWKDAYFDLEEPIINIVRWVEIMRLCFNGNKTGLALTAFEKLEDEAEALHKLYHEQFGEPRDREPDGASPPRPRIGAAAGNSAAFHRHIGASPTRPGSMAPIRTKRASLMLGAGGFEAMISSNRNMKISASMVASSLAFFVRPQRSVLDHCPLGARRKSA